MSVNYLARYDKLYWEMLRRFNRGKHIDEHYKGKDKARMLYGKDSEAYKLSKCGQD